MGRNHERIVVMHEIIDMIQEKDAEGDDIAADVLLWAWRRLINSPNNVID